MLAERKSKERWSQDPRNKQWSNDTKRFGYRMLQQMGWEKGRGLGAQEDGTTEHVMVSRKTSNKGVGSKKGRDDGWIEHQNDFDDILAQLNKQQADDQLLFSVKESAEASAGGDSVQPQARALVETAADSKRLIYSKFLRSKDLSTASPKDMDSVLGRKRRSKDLSAASPRDDLESEPHRKKSRPATPEPQQSLHERDTPITTHGITTVTRKQSIHDYFSAKLGSQRSGSSRKKKKKGKTESVCADEDLITAMPSAQANVETRDSK